MDRKVIKVISDDLTARMSTHVNSMCATDDEVSIAVLLNEIDQLDKKLTSLSAPREGEVLYRIYADGSVVHEDDFDEKDHEQPYYDDYRTMSLPTELIDFIMEV